MAAHPLAAQALGLERGAMVAHRQSAGRSTALRCVSLAVLPVQHRAPLCIRLAELNCWPPRRLACICKLPPAAGPDICQHYLQRARWSEGCHEWRTTLHSCRLHAACLELQADLMPSPQDSTQPRQVYSPQLQHGWLLCLCSDRPRNLKDSCSQSSQPSQRSVCDTQVACWAEQTATQTAASCQSMQTFSTWQFPPNMAACQQPGTTPSGYSC